MHRRDVQLLASSSLECQCYLGPDICTCGFVLLLKGDLRDTLCSLMLRVVLPLRRAGKPPGRKSPKNGEKLQNSPPRSDPRKWGKITEKLQKMYFRSNFTPFLGQFPHFRGSDRGGEFCNFSPFFGDFRPGGFPGPLRGKPTRNISESLINSK